MKENIFTMIFDVNWMRYELPFKEQLALVTKNMLMIRRKKKSS